MSIIKQTKINPTITPLKAEPALGIETFGRDFRLDAEHESPTRRVTSKEGKGRERMEADAVEMNEVKEETGSKEKRKSKFTFNQGLEIAILVYLVYMNMQINGLYEQIGKILLKVTM